ncbi:MAG: fluoride efflux transporter CrcB [Acidiferrobacterales bacterium]
MNQFLAIAAGGAIGSVLRYWVSINTHAIFGRDFPYGTLTVNVIGSLLMGLLFVLFVERWEIETVIRSAILIGLLGAFTTFSTFSIETLNLVEDGSYAKALVNILVSVSASLAAAWLGIIIGRQI